jgi:cell division protein FtsB
VFFGIEVIVFVAMYCFGAVGVQAIVALYRKNRLLEQSVAIIKNEMDDLLERNTEWNEYPFYKEKAAREKLHMAYKNDRVYVIND